MPDVSARVDERGEGESHLLLLVNHEGDAPGNQAEGFLEAVGRAHPSCRIGQQRKGQSVILRESCVALDAILADAKNTRAEGRKLGVLVSKSASLQGANRRFVLWVKKSTIFAVFTN